MHNRDTSVLAVLVGVILCGPPVLTMHAPTNPAVPDEYTGTTVNMAPGGGNKLLIQVLRWSSEADREGVMSLVAAAPGARAEKLVKRLQEMSTVGYIWTDRALGYGLKYAYRHALPNGGESVVLLTDRPLGNTDRSGPWKASTGSKGTEYPFTVLELHLNRDGHGQGKMSLSTSLAVDKNTHTVALVNYLLAPVLLQDVEQKPTPYWARES